MLGLKEINVEPWRKIFGMSRGYHSFKGAMEQFGRRRAQNPRKARVPNS